MTRSNRSARRLLAGWNAATVTWNSRQSGSAWTAPGADFAATTSTTNTGTTIGSLRWGVSSDVAAFVGGSAGSFGWLLKDATEGSGGIEFQFGAKGNGSVAARPQLVVMYGACL